MDFIIQLQCSNVQFGMLCSYCGCFFFVCFFNLKQNRNTGRRSVETLVYFMTDLGYCGALNLKHDTFC